MRQTFYTLLAALFFTSCAISQSVTTGQADGRRPKLIVGITVDQMRYDYIERYWNDYSEGGFKRLVNDGFICRNLHYNYMPTYTAPGHASIFTGTTPAYHGIIENDWYNRYTGKYIYCAGDPDAKGVGSDSDAGKMSPVNLLSTTIGDELKLFSNNRSRVFGIAMKDRGAILPAGRTADAAYWFISGKEGVWASSNWYMEQLPKWVSDFNSSGRADYYMKQTWNLLRDISVYDESMEDNNAHEIPFTGMAKPVFPYNMKELAAENGHYDMIKATPFGNSLTVDFAKALLKNEKLGKGVFTDMLCMSFSSTDYVGHQFGIHSIETQDCYLRLDLEIADFLNYLDQEYGKGNYLVFLSADHGGTPTPSYMQKRHGAYGYWKSSALEKKVQDELSAKYGEGEWLLNESNQNIFLNRVLIAKKQLSLNAIQDEVAEMIHDFPEMFMTFTAHDLANFSGGHPIREMVQRGFSQKYSGDVIYVLKPGYFQYGPRGTSHGSVYAYDTQVPAIFYGFGVNKGETHERHVIPDIAPTITAICKISNPSACTGAPVIEAIKKEE